MAEEDPQGAPLIDADKIKGIVNRASVQVPAADVQSKEASGKKPAKGPYCWGTGRRKSAVARVRVRPGSGKININGREVDAYFPGMQDRLTVRAPLETTDNISRYDVFVNVQGGGPTGQAGAVMLGLARALVTSDPDCFGALRDSGYLTRDSRMKERKKYGQKGARKKFQFSKR